MIMKAIKTVAGFSAGVAIGALAGAAAGYLSAPRSGDDLRKESHELIDSAKQAGERARIDREAELRDKFRNQVGNQQALSAPVDETVIAGTPPATAHPFPS